HAIEKTENNGNSHGMAPRKPKRPEDNSRPEVVQAENKTEGDKIEDHIPALASPLSGGPDAAGGRAAFRPAVCRDWRPAPLLRQARGRGRGNRRGRFGQRRRSAGMPGSGIRRSRSRGGRISGMYQSSSLFRRSAGRGGTAPISIPVDARSRGCEYADV